MDFSSSSESPDVRIRPCLQVEPTTLDEGRVLEVVLQYVRVEDSLPLSEAAGSLRHILVIPSSGSLSPDVSVFWGRVLTVAEHIPYNHPSQVKLARLIAHLQLSISNAFPVFRDKFESMKFSLDMDLMKATVHERYNPAFPPPSRDTTTSFSDRARCWVNMNTLYANLHSLSGGSLAYFGAWVLREAFESTSATYFAALNCHISAAAQWMIYSGQTILRDILVPPGPAGLSQQESDQTWNMDSWRKWKSSFLNASIKVTLYEESRELARRAATIMDALEISMQGVPDRL